MIRLDEFTPVHTLSPVLSQLIHYLTLHTNYLLSTSKIKLTSLSKLLHELSNVMFLYYIVFNNVFTSHQIAHAPLSIVHLYLSFETKDNEKKMES